MPPFHVVPEGAPWPSGDFQNVAVLPLKHDDVSRTLGAPLVRGVEAGLGEWHVLGIRLSSGDLAELIHYTDSPGPRGFTLRVDTRTQAAVALREVLAVFNLTRSSLPWVAAGL